jgi:hypothetical protein
LSRPGIFRARVEFPGGFGLRQSKAGSGISSFAHQCHRIELALPRVFMSAILDAVHGVALLEYGVMKQ